MSTQIVEIAGIRCAVLDTDGPIVRDQRGGRDLIEEAMNADAAMIVVPVARLDATFFELHSGLAGEILQKAANYGYKFAIIGDIGQHVAASGALRDFVRECNRGTSIFFDEDLHSLENRLSRLREPSSR
jgi:hypothetical protein